MDAAALMKLVLADEQLLSEIRLNTFSHCLMYQGEPLTDPSRSALLIRLQKKHQGVGSRALNQVLAALEQNESIQFNPLTDWLDSLRWDGELRLPTLFQEYCFANPQMMNPAYLRSVAENFFTGLVARAYRPGCKMDNMLILEGDQGIGKSRGLRAIGGEYYRENKVNDVGSKDMLQALHGSWLYDINELNAFSKVDTRMVKAFLSADRDVVRLPYRRDMQCYLRTCVVVGTTNDEIYLHDETGHRRFWPVRCGYQIEVDMLTAHREQLFAEAVERFRAGNDWWTLDEHVQQEITAARAFISPLFDAISAYIGNGTHLPRYADDEQEGKRQSVFCYVTPAMVCEALNIRIDSPTSYYNRELNRCMRSLGYEKVRQRRSTVFGEPERELKVLIYRRLMGPRGAVLLVPERTPEPALRVVPFEVKSHLKAKA